MESRDLMTHWSAAAANPRGPRRRRCESFEPLRAAFTGGKEKTARQAELEQQWAAFAKEKYAAAKAKADEALKLVR